MGFSPSDAGAGTGLGMLLHRMGQRGSTLRASPWQPGLHFSWKLSPAEQIWRPQCQGDCWEYQPSGSGHKESSQLWIQMTPHFLASHFFLPNNYHSPLIRQPAKVKFMPFLNRPSSHWFELGPETQVSANTGNILTELHLPLLRKTVLFHLDAESFWKPSSGDETISMS